jgi:GTPase SAR1 family protein
MFNRPSKVMAQRLRRLKAHLREENPLLVEVVDRFQELDRVGYALGVLSPDQSYATRISWWPLISVLGTFSSGKSTFINNYLGRELQDTGNQAVDEKYSVICFSADPDSHVLPGVALDADPRFPFYQISEEIDHVSPGEGARVDSYIQLKTCPAEPLRGRILIDSPGFDADEQRNSILRITDHIIDLSDLTLVFFDARHPEPGAMRDTLEHLVKRTTQRSDAGKLLFILNQIDTTWREDNLEDVVAAWQRAVAQEGISTGRFYCVYNDNAAVEIEDPALAARYRGKSETDLSEIRARIDKVGIERIYRIIGALENSANELQHQAVPRLRDAVDRWARGVLWTDGALLTGAVLGAFGFTLWAGYWDGLSFEAPWLAEASARPVLTTLLAILALVLLVAMHFSVRRWVAGRVAQGLARSTGGAELARAFLKNTRFWRSLIRPHPVGWGSGSQRRLDGVRRAADQFVQRLNDRFTDPSGKRAADDDQPQAPADDPLISRRSVQDEAPASASRG